MACSFRKWFAVPSGGIAVKYGSPFGVTPDPIHKVHIEHRHRFMEFAKNATSGFSEQKEASEAFWDGELLLREIFGTQQSDAASVEILRHYPIERMINKRRENFLILSEMFPKSTKLTPVFSVLPEGACPSHFPVYSQGPTQRDEMQKSLARLGISSTVYWPVPPFINIDMYPEAKWIYERILALPCDQRYSPEQMDAVGNVLNELLQ